MLHSIEHHKPDTTSPWVPSSNQVEVPKRNSASTSSNALSRPNEDLRNMPSLRYPPGLDHHPTDGLEGKGHDKTAGQVAQRARRSLSHLPSIPEDQPLPSERPKPQNEETSNGEETPRKAPNNICSVLEQSLSGIPD